MARDCALCCTGVASFQINAIDSCSISVDPHDHLDDYKREHISYPVALVAQLQLEVFLRADGLIISGTPLSKLIPILNHSQC